MSKFLPIRHSSCSCAAGDTHSPFNNMVQPLQCLFLQAAHMPTGLLIHSSRTSFCTGASAPAHWNSRALVFKYTLQVPTCVYHTWEHNPSYTTTSSHKHPTTFTKMPHSSVSTSASLSYAGDSFMQPVKSHRENLSWKTVCYKEGLTFLSDSANQLSRPFITETHQVFYLLHTVCGASGR